VIKIDEQPQTNQFLFDILVDIHADTAEKLLGLHEVLEDSKYDDLRIQTLKDLGVLSEYLPVVNDYLASKAEEPAAIRSDAFVNVWFESLPILRILGIRTIIPKSLRNVIAPQLALAASTTGSLKRVKTYLDLASVLRFRWEVAIGDKVVDADEFFDYVERLSGIVKYQDQYVFIDQKEMAKLLKTSQKDIPNLSPMDMLRIGLEERYKGNPVAVPEKIKQLLEKLFSAGPVELPEGLLATLRPYQERGLQWLYHHSKIGFGSILADDMGLGKTIQVITLLLKRKEESQNGQPSLVIVPTTLLTNWEHECRKFAPSLTTAIYHGPERELTTDCDVVLTTYAIARNDLKQLKKQRWNYVILDEAQNIKNHTAAQTKAVKALPANTRIAMTGTPVENSLMEYWSIMDFLNKGLLGNITTFRKEVAMPIEKYRDQERLRQFLKVTAPFILRRVKTDKSIIQDLPDKIQIDEYCKLTQEQAAIYQNIVEQTMETIESAEGIQRKGLVLKLILSLKQVCNHPANYLKSGKRDLARSGKAMLLKSLLAAPAARTPLPSRRN
jgi:SNF2 family DNA or RNA helicase